MSVFEPVAWDAARAYAHGSAPHLGRARPCRALEESHAGSTARPDLGVARSTGRAGGPRAAPPLASRRGRRYDDETLFRAVAAAADAIYVVDATGRIAFLNPAALAALGYADETELLGKACHELVHRASRAGSSFPVEECRFLRPLLTGETVGVEEDWFVRKDRTHVAVSYVSTPVDLDNGPGALVAFQGTAQRLRLDEVEASRARIAVAADEARRRIERDLHDGAQQRLVSLALEVRVAAAMTPPGLGELQAQLSRIERGLGEALEELREIARGIHPAVLTEGGLDPALRSLARRSGIPAQMDLRIGQRLPERIEAAAYYLISEALTNAAKHSQAPAVYVEVVTEHSSLLITIRDEGVGGADHTRGSGLIGLRDRVETLGGTLQISSPVGRGTSLRVTIPVPSSLPGAV